MSTNKTELKEALKIYEDILKDFALAPDYSDKEYLIRDEIINDYIFPNEVDPLDEELTIGGGFPYVKDADVYLENFDELSDLEKATRTAKHWQTVAENNLIPYEIALALQARLRNDLFKEKFAQNKIQGKLLSETISALRVLDLNMFADILEYSELKLNVDLLKQKVKTGRPPIKTEKRGSITPYIIEKLKRNPEKSNMNIAGLAIQALANSYEAESDCDEINNTYKQGSVRIWVAEEREKLKGK